MSRDEAVDCVVRCGSFPGGMRVISDVPRWKSYVRDSIIDPALGRDLMVLLEFARRWPDYRPLVLCDDEFPRRPEGGSGFSCLE